MRELLDRLLEARTAMDDRLREEHQTEPPFGSCSTMQRLWTAKYHLWKATMLVLETGERPPAPAEEKPDLWGFP